MAKKKVIKKAKAKKTSKKAVVPIEPKERISLVERVRRESKELGGTGPGKKRVIARMAFFLWLGIPTSYKGAPDVVIQKLGIADPDILELIKISTVEQFKELFDVRHQAVSDWRKEFAASDEGKDTRAFFRGLMREVLGAVYREALVNGDAERFKALAAYVEGWTPTQNLHLSGDTGGGLTEEEQEAMDALVAKNKGKKL